MYGAGDVNGAVGTEVLADEGIDGGVDSGVVAWFGVVVEVSGQEPVVGGGGGSQYCDAGETCVMEGSPTVDVGNR